MVLNAISGVKQGAHGAPSVISDVITTTPLTFELVKKYFACRIPMDAHVVR